MSCFEHAPQKEKMKRVYKYYINRVSFEYFTFKQVRVRGGSTLVTSNSSAPTSYGRAARLTRIFYLQRIRLFIDIFLYFFAVRLRARTHFYISPLKIHTEHSQVCRVQFVLIMFFKQKNATVVVLISKHQNENDQVDA